MCERACMVWLGIAHPSLAQEVHGATRDGAERCRWVIISASVCLWSIGYRLLCVVSQPANDAFLSWSVTTDLAVIRNDLPLFIDYCAISEMYTVQANITL